MKTVLAAAFAVIMASGGCGSSDKPTGTRDDPIVGKKAGRFCTSPGQWAVDDKGRELVCRRREGDATPRWLSPND